jgi:hypothetical protein
MDPAEEESEWNQITGANWHGLGLTDPIKNVEVRQRRPGYLQYLNPFSRINGFSCRLS